VLYPSIGVTEVQTVVHGFELHHWPDNTKSRGSYLPLLAMSVKEDPANDRNSHYYGRELMYHQRYKAAITELERHLKLPSSTWDAERANSMRYIGRCYKWLNDWDQAERWLLRACAEAPLSREPWVELAQLYYDLRKYSAQAAAAERALSIKERPMSYMCEPGSWGAIPYDLAALGCWYSGRKEDGLKYAEEAIKLEPTDPRLQNNVKLMNDVLQSHKGSSL